MSTRVHEGSALPQALYHKTSDLFEPQTGNVMDYFFRKNNCIVNNTIPTIPGDGDEVHHQIGKKVRDNIPKDYSMIF